MPKYNANITASSDKRRGHSHKKELGSRLVEAEPRTTNITIAEMSNRAIALYSSGDYGNASKMFHEAASLRQHANSATVVDSLYHVVDEKANTPCPSLSSCIYQCMDFDEGMNFFQEAKPINAEDCPQTVAAVLFFNAGQAKRRMEDFEGAMSYYERATNIIAPLSHNGMQTLFIALLHNTGHILYRTGNSEKAINIYKSALNQIQSIPGDQRLLIASTFNCLGVLFYHKSSEGDDTAMKYFEQALGIQTSVLGTDHEIVATTTNNIGRVHVKRENFTDALRYYEEALRVRRLRLGVESMDYAVTAFNVGQSLHQQGEFDRAMQLYYDFLRVAKVGFSKDHRDIAIVLSGIAQIHQERKEHDKALELYEESVRVGRAALGEDHSVVAMLLSRIGNFHFERQDLDKALRAYQSGLKIERKVLEASHPNIIVTLSNISEIYKQRGDNDPAVQLYREVLKLKRSQTANQRGHDVKMLISGENESIDGDKQKLMYCSEDDGSEHCSSVLQHDAQSPAPLGMLAELASAREATETKAYVSKDPTRHVISRESGAREVDSIKWGRSHGNTATAVSFLPLPHNDRRPSPSRRGRSDGSGDSIHRAETPKSHNMLLVASDDRSRRGRTKVGVGAPEMPDLKADKDAGGAKQQLQSRPAEKETATAGQKRRAEGAKMELPKAIKRQRSFPQGGFMGSRPPLIINRQRSTGSRLSFADEVQIAEPGFFGETLSDRRPGPAAPSALRRGDRHGSMGSLQPPSVIRAGDRQGSVESYQSLRSQDSAMQTLTLNSRLTPSLLGPASTLSPNTGTPNTARMEELYDQLDRQLEECIPQFSPSPKSMSNESPGQRFPSFRPRPMNGKRQASAAMEEADLHGDLKLPSPSQLEIQKGNGTEREVNVDRQRDLASRHTRIGEGLPSLQIPNPGDTDRSKMTTPTGQIRSFPHGGRKAVALRQPTANPNPPGRNKTYPNAQTHGSQIQMPQQSMHRMASVDSHVRPAPMAPMQPDFLKAWLEGSGETPSMEQNFRAPQPRAFQQIPQGPDSHSRIPPSFQQPHIRNPHTYEGRGQPPARVPGYESYLPNHRPDVSQLRPRKVVEFGHPREDVVEGRQIYSRHTLLLWGAHKSDVCPVNGNPRDGCDSIIYMNEGGEVPNTKDDLGFLQLKCSQRNGGDALFANYQKSQQRNATHSYPIRVFRKTTDLSGASGFRYDGLYHVAAIHDDRGRPRSEPSNSSKTFSFLLKRNIAGQAGDQNQHMLEELWGVVQQGDPPPHQQQQRHVGGVQTNDLHLPPLSHGGRGYRGGHQQGAMGVTAPMHPHLKRMSSAEVSLIHIRYYDQDQQNHHLNQVQRLQVLLQQGPPSAVPSAQPWAAR